MFCSVCNKEYTSVTVLKIHYLSTIHKNNLRARAIQSEIAKQVDVITIPQVPELQIIGNIPQANPTNPISNIEINQEAIPDNNPPEQIPTDEKASEEIPSVDSIIDSLPENTENNTNINQSNKYECPGCAQEYAQKPSLYRHQKKCKYYKEAYKLSSETQLDIKVAAKLIKQKKLAKNIPHLRIEQNVKDYIPICPNTTNNITNNNNNTTINNINITVGNWETLSFVRPFLHENISHLYTLENRLKIIKSGNNAVNTVIDLIYELPENKNLYRYNSRKNFVKTLNVNGEVVSYLANEAFGQAAIYILDITDDIMTNSEDILEKFPEYRRGVEVYGITNNWNGEGGNDRYKEYELKIELNVETSRRSAEINIIRFENEKRKIILNGGSLNFSGASIQKPSKYPEAQIQETIIALKEKLCSVPVC